MTLRGIRLFEGSKVRKAVDLAVQQLNPTLLKKKFIERIALNDSNMSYAVGALKRRFVVDANVAAACLFARIYAAQKNSGENEKVSDSPTLPDWTDLLFLALKNAGVPDLEIPAMAEELVQMNGAVLGYERFEDADQPSSSEKGARDFATYSDWLAAFKAACGRANPKLAVNEKGGSLVDYMEQEGLKRAFADGVDPHALGREFATKFDIRQFGG